tara:strand:- start:22 stop:315 length:294 start_codon:yes stop_codon:yes gene_type:complete
MKVKKSAIATTYATSIQSISAGNLDRKYISAEKSSVPVKDSIKPLMLSIFKQNTTPKTNPAAVPTKPTIDPDKKKIRVMAARDAPIVRKMAIELVLS